MTANLARTDKAALEKYLSLPQGKSPSSLSISPSVTVTSGPRVCATYVWIDGSGETMRSKVKVLETKPSKVEDLPQWNYDGSSCYQANGDNSDVYLTPVKMYPCPFTRGDNLLVLCETYNYLQKTMPTNHRKQCQEYMDLVKDEKPWFGIEQEYTLFDCDKHPFGWPKNGFPGPQVGNS